MTHVNGYRVERFEEVQPFLDSAGSFLGEHEAEHNLIFGIAATFLADPEYPSAPLYMATVSRGGQVVLTAIMTPPWNLVLSWTAESDALEAMAADLAAGGFEPPGVTGPSDLAHEFARIWCDPRGLVSRVSLPERIYRLEHVTPPVGVPGEVRVGTEADRDLLISWVYAFLKEAMSRGSQEEAAVIVDRSFRRGTRTWYVWEDGGPVSVAASTGPTPNGIRIGPVYTPPEFRGHGYASAVTAAASQAELDNGRRFVFLFTDLANPTSNRIYQQIGYRPVIDVDQIAFTSPGDAPST